MKKRLLMSVALVATLATLTGCGSNTKTLTCTQNTSDNGFSDDEKIVIKFKDNEIQSATQTSTITAEGDYAKYIDDYKSSADEAVENYNKVSGLSAKVQSGTNKVSVVVEMTADKMDDENRAAYGMNESYESMQDRLTNQGYTCK